MHRTDAPGNIAGQFTDGSVTPPLQEATVLGAAWHNAVQEEIAHVIESVGLTLSKPDNTQLRAAMDALYGRLASANTWSQANSFQRGATVTQATADTAGITTTGNGTGAGVVSTGGATGPGGTFAAGGGDAAGLTSTGAGTGPGVQGTGGATSGPGGTFFGGAPNGPAVSATGTGSGAGVAAVGGPTGQGGTFAAGGGNAAGSTSTGSGSGAGVVGVGGGSSGAGGTFTAGAGSGNGVSGTATGSGTGVVGVGGGTAGLGGSFTGGAGGGSGLVAQGTGTGGFGLVATGGTNSTGVVAIAGTAATAATPQAALQCQNGYLGFSSAANPNSNVAFTNTLTPANICKVLAVIQTNGAGGVTLLGGFNVTSVALIGGNLRVTFAAPFASSTYGVFASNTVVGYVAFPLSGTITANSVDIQLFISASGSQQSLATFATTVMVEAIGAQ